MININQVAPVKCRKKIIINAHTVEVWKVLTDINKWTQWQTDIISARMNGPLQEGTTFEWISGGLKIRSTIQTVQPYSVFGWTGKALGLYAIHNWHITELNSQTEITVEESMEGFLAGLFKGMLNKNLDKSLGRWLDFLKTTCEKSTYVKPQ